MPGAEVIIDVVLLSKAACNVINRFSFALDCRFLEDLPSCSLESPNVEVAQHHISSPPGTPFAHSKRALFDENLKDYKVMPRLELPHVQDSKTWKMLDTKIVQELALVLPPPILQFADINEVVYKFESHV